MVRMLLVAAALIVLAGCGSADNDPNLAAAVPEPAAPCEADFGEPIGLDRAMNAMRSAGLSIALDRSPCASGIASFDNTASGSFETEGQVHCVVHASPPHAAPSSIRRRGADGADVELTLENLECTLLADSVDAEAKIDRLEAAFDDLERQIRK